MKKLFLLALVIGLIFLIKIDQSFQPENFEELQERARSVNSNVPKQFTTDGCSLFPNCLLGENLTEICIEHDLKYWAGGSEEERRQADLVLRDAVNEKIKFLGDVMYWKSRIGGHSLIPSPWRWGYGHGYW